MSKGFSYDYKKVLMNKFNYHKNNIVNAGTPGFKANIAYIENQKTSNGNFEYIIKDRIDFAQAEILKTEKEFDYAIDGRGLFFVECDGENRFAAAGNFNVDTDGYLKGSNDCYLLAEKYQFGENIAKTSILKDSYHYERIQISVGDLIKGTETTKVNAKVILSAEQLAVGGGTIKITAPTVTAGDSFTMTFYQKIGDFAVTSKTLIFQKSGGAAILGAIGYTDQKDFEAKLQSNAGSYFSFISEASGNQEFTLYGSLNNNVRLKFGGNNLPVVKDPANSNILDGSNFVKSPYDAADPANNMTGGKYKADFVEAFPIYDSFGGKHIAFAAFKKTDVSKYTVEIYTKTQVVGDAKPIAAGVVSFDSQGKMSGIPGKVDTFNGYTPGNIHDSLTFTWDSGITTASPTTLKINWEKMEMFGDINMGHSNNDGNTITSLFSTTVDNHGNIVGVYTNGMQKYIAAIPVVTFKNSEALQSASGTVFMETINSGEAKYNMSGDQGVGKVVAGYLTASNVDIAKESLAIKQLVQQLSVLDKMEVKMIEATPLFSLQENLCNNETADSEIDM
ncbi:MAG: flagellar hook-basal body protein [Candidatus Midichloriaceae bacterium]|jgi:flagellar hook-basal body protein